MRLSYCKKLTDMALKEIGRRCKNLSDIQLFSCFNITDEGFKALAACPNLKTMDVTCCFNITEEGFTFVKKAQNFHYLCAYGCPFVQTPIVRSVPPEVTIALPILIPIRTKLYWVSQARESMSSSVVGMWKKKKGSSSIICQNLVIYIRCNRRKLFHS